MTPTLGPSDHTAEVAPPWRPGDRGAVLLLVLLAPGVLVVDYFGGRTYALHLFYLVPTAIAAWTFGLKAGMGVALMAAVYSSYVAIETRAPGASLAGLAWEAAWALALFSLVAQIVGRHRRLLMQLAATARIDLATGALAPREFARVIDTEARRALRYNRPLSLVVVRAAQWRGETQLAAVVRTISREVRSSDSVARIDDRSIAMVLVECGPTKAQGVASRVCAALLAAEKHLPRSLALGIACRDLDEPLTGAEMTAIALREALPLPAAAMRDPPQERVPVLDDAAPDAQAA